MIFFQATKWFNKALDTVDVLMNGVDAGCFYKYVETKGRLLDRLGNMKTHERSYHAAEKMLRRAEKCMEECGSLLGNATVQHHMGILRYTRTKFLDNFRIFQR